MRKIIIAMLILVAMIPLTARIKSGWNLMTVSTTDSLLGACDTFDYVVKKSSWGTYWDKNMTFGVWYWVASAADTLSIAVDAISYINGSENKTCQYASAFTADSVMNYSFLPDTVAFMIMYSDSIKLRCITTGQAADTAFIDLYIGYTSFNQERW